MSHLVVHSIQQPGHSRHHSRPQGFHIFGQPFDIAAVKSYGSAHHVHAIFAASFQHVRQRQEADHRVLVRGLVLAQLNEYRAYARYHVLVRQHHAFRVTRGPRCVGYGAQIGRFGGNLRVILLGAQPLHVVELEQLDATVLRPLVRRLSCFFYHHYFS